MLNEDLPHYHPRGGVDRDPSRLDRVQTTWPGQRNRRWLYGSAAPVDVNTESLTVIRRRISPVLGKTPPVSQELPANPDSHAAVEDPLLGGSPQQMSTTGAGIQSRESRDRLLFG